VNEEPTCQPVLFYDARCGLCNRVVRLLLRTDRAGRLRFATLQGEKGQAYLRLWKLPTQDFDSLVFAPDWSAPDRFAPRLRTDGALAAAAAIGGVWRLITWARLLPVWLRDPVYRLVARTRYSLFGEYQPSPLPDPEWAKRFL